MTKFKNFISSSKALPAEPLPEVTTAALVVAAAFAVTTLDEGHVLVVLVAEQFILQTTPPSF